MQMKICLIALFITTLSAGNQALAQADVNCLIYASKAVRAQHVNAKTCRLTGPRWQDNFDVHYNWCRTASGALQARETDARRDAQAACKIGTVSQALVNGDPVPVDVQREFGLVTVSGSCSGTLINRHYVLTAAHCISTDGTVGGPTLPLDKIVVQATWDPGSYRARRVVRYNSSPLCPPGAACPRGLDIALIMLGHEAGKLDGKTKLLYVGSPHGATDVSLSARAYGRGLATTATEGPPPTAGTFDDAYRTGVFPIRAGSDIEYFLTPGAGGEVVGGGDSGGPDWVLTPDGAPLGILGVHSKCWFDYAIGHGDLPDGRADWQWAKEIHVCVSDAIHTIRDDIIREMHQPPEAVGPAMADDIDRPGSDYSRFTLAGRKPEACQDACKRGQPRCKAWTYVRPGIQEAQSVCYLKDAVPPQQSNDCCISGEPLHPSMQVSMDRPGSDYHRFLLGSPTPELCRKACADDARCAAWTYVRPGVQGPQAVCYLKDPAPAATPNECCISGEMLMTPSLPRKIVPAPQDTIAGVGFENIDRPGSDYHRFELAEPEPSVCRKACAEDARCKAWTYVRPGVQGQQAVCYLKDPAPMPKANDCCISGAK